MLRVLICVCVSVRYWWNHLCRYRDGRALLAGTPQQQSHHLRGDIQHSPSQSPDHLHLHADALRLSEPQHEGVQEAAGDEAGADAAGRHKRLHLAEGDGHRDC